MSKLVVFMGENKNCVLFYRKED